MFIVTYYRVNIWRVKPVDVKLIYIIHRLFMPNNSYSVNLRKPTLFWNDVRQREFWGFVILIIEHRYIIIIEYRISIPLRLLLNNSIQNYLHIKYRNVERNPSRRSTRDGGH